MLFPKVLSLLHTFVFICFSLCNVYVCISLCSFFPRKFTFYVLLDGNIVSSMVLFCFLFVKKKTVLTFRSFALYVYIIYVNMVLQTAETLLSSEIEII